MAAMWRTPARWALLLGLTGGLTGCLAAAAAAAGAGTGVYLTSRGAESIVKGSVDQVAARARAVLKAEGVAIDATSMESSGDKRETKGTKGDLDIAVSMERQSPTTTKTEVTARKNLAEWDKDYAQRILDKIIKS
jgi:peroxiredoxin family protein